MNKQELAAVVAAKSGLTKVDAEKAVKAFVEAVVEEVAKKGAVRLVGFGTFEARERAARTGRNPQTGKAIEIAATTVPAFKAGKAFKAAVNPAKKEAKPVTKNGGKKGKKK